MRRIAWYSTIASNATLRSTEFTRRVLPELQRFNEVSLFVGDEDYQQINDYKHLYDFDIQHYHRCGEMHHNKPFDVFCYQIEDHPLLDFSVRSASLRPGIVFAHDLILNKLFFSRFNHISTGLELNNEIVASFGGSAIRLGDLLVRKVPLDVFSFVYPVSIDSFCASSIAATFVDPAAQWLDDKSNGQVKPNLCHFPLKNDRKCGLPISPIIRGAGDKTVVGFVVESVIEDQLGCVLEVLSLFRGTNVCFVVFSNQSRVSCHLSELCRDFASVNGYSDLKVIEYDNPDGLKSLISDCDVVVGYRFEPRKNLPLKIIYAIEQHVPVIIGSLGAERDIPDSVAVKVNSGYGASKEILQAIDLLCNSDRRAHIRKAQAEYVARFNASNVAIEVDNIIKAHQLELKRRNDLHDHNIRQGMANLQKLAADYDSDGERCPQRSNEFVNNAAKAFGW